MDRSHETVSERPNILVDEHGQPLPAAPTDEELTRYGVSFYAEVDGDLVTSKPQVAQRWLNAWHGYALGFGVPVGTTITSPQPEGSGRYRTIAFTPVALSEEFDRVGTQPGSVALTAELEAQESLVKGLEARFDNPFDHDETGYLQLSSYIIFRYDDRRAQTVELNRMVDVYIAALQDAPVVFGQAPGEGKRTALDAALRRHSDVSRRQARVYLRGYNWLTVCNSSLAARLGGAGALRATGAFARVEELSDDSILLQATPHFDDCLDEPNRTNEAIRPVFNALAPVLPPGMPKPGAPYDPIVGPLVYEAPPQSSTS
jgi:hypothetical protein